MLPYWSSFKSRAKKIQEATRIPTPPLDEDTADGRVRGFFTSGTPPAMDGSLPPSSPIRGPRIVRSDVHRRSLSSQPKEWWENMPQIATRRDQMVVDRSFDFNVPDHLPNSPMCPANRKHRNGGTGLCVYHGRSKGGSMLKDEPMTMGSDEGLLNTQVAAHRW